MAKVNLTTVYRISPEIKKMALVVDNVPVIHVFPYRQNETRIIYDKIKQQSRSEPWSVYLKEDIPPRYHYRQNDRIPPILLVADEPYILTASTEAWTVVGMHGYDRDVGHTILPFVYSLTFSLYRIQICTGFYLQLDPRSKHHRVDRLSRWKTLKFTIS